MVPDSAWENVAKNQTQAGATEPGEPQSGDTLNGTVGGQPRHLDGAENGETTHIGLLHSLGLMKGPQLLNEHLFCGASKMKKGTAITSRGNI